MVAVEFQNTGSFTEVKCLQVCSGVTLGNEDLGSVQDFILLF